MKEERKRSEKRKCVRCGEEFEGSAIDLYCERCKKKRAYFTLFR